MKIILTYLLVCCSWAETSQSHFNVPTSDNTSQETDQLGKKVDVLQHRLDSMENDIRSSLRETLNGFENRDGSISPRLRSILGNPDASLGKIIAYMFERQQTSMQTEIDGMKSQLKQLQDTVDAMNGELASYAARFKPPKESKSAVKQRMRGLRDQSSSLVTIMDNGH